MTNSFTRPCVHHSCLTIAFEMQSMGTFVEEHAAIKFNLPSLEQYIREDEYDEYSGMEEGDDNVADADASGSHDEL